MTPKIFTDYVIDILSYVRDHPGCDITHVKSATVDSGTINRLIREFVDSGMLDLERGLAHNSKYLTLTPKGTRILRHAIAIQDTLEGNDPLQDDFDRGPSDEEGTPATI